MAEALLVLALVLSPWYYGGAPDAGRYSLASVLLFSAACAAASRSAWRGPLLWPALALPLVGMAQLVFGTSVAPAFSVEAVLMLLAMLGAMLLVHDRARDRTASWRLAAAVLVGVFAQAAFGALSWSIAPARIYGQGRPDITMPFGSFVNHNHFAGFVEMGALLALGMAVGHARRARSLTPASIGLLGLSLAMAAAHVASRSRGGLLALAAGIIVCGALSAGLWRSESAWQARRRVIFAAGGAVLVLGFALSAVSPTARRHLATLLLGQAGTSGSYRVDMARSTLRLAAAHPVLGSGLGAYEDAVPPFKRGHGELRATHAESDVLELIAESGLLGALAVGWLGLAILRSFQARLATGRDPFRKGLAIGALSGAAALAVHGLVDFNLRVPSNALLFAVLLGLASAPAQDAPPPGPVRYPWLTAGVLAALAVLAMWRAEGALALERGLSASDPNVRIERLDAAIRRHPYLAEAWRARGLAWRDLASPKSALGSLRLSRAQEDLSAALRLRPHWAELWADSGWTRAMRGDIDGGRRELDQALRLDPTHAGIQRVHAEFLRRVDK